MICFRIGNVQLLEKGLFGLYIQRFSDKFLNSHIQIFNGVTVAIPFRDVSFMHVLS